MQLLSFKKNSVLVNLLASINEANKRVAAEQSGRSSIFNFITGSSSATSADTMCHRCQEREQRYVCETCSGDAQKPTKLCQECHTLIHSLGKAFMAHKVHECVAFSSGDAQQHQASQDDQNRAEQQKMLISKLVKLEECPKHQLPIEYYLDEELDEDDEAAAATSIELSGVTYGCQRCLASTDLSKQGNFSKIDKDNLLNVH